MLIIAVSEYFKSSHFFTLCICLRKDSYSPNLETRCLPLLMLL